MTVPRASIEQVKRISYRRILFLRSSILPLLASLFLSPQSQATTSSAEPARLRPQDCYSYDPRLLAFAPKPNCAFHAVDQQTGNDIRYNLNSMGLRNREITKRDPKSIRVLLLGPLAFGKGLPETSTPAVLLEQNLNAFHPFRSAGNRFEVINGGLNGFGANRSNLFYRELMLEIDPTIVVYLLSGHDIPFEFMESKAFVRDDQGRPTSLSGHYGTFVGADAFLKPEPSASLEDSIALTKQLWQMAFQGHQRVNTIVSDFAWPLRNLMFHIPMSGDAIVSLAPFRSNAKDTFNLLNGRGSLFSKFISPGFNINGHEAARVLLDFVKTQAFSKKFAQAADDHLMSENGDDHLTKDGSALWASDTAQLLVNDSKVAVLLAAQPPLHLNPYSGPGALREKTKKPSK